MQVILKRTVEGVGVYMPLDEALAFLKDPARAQREVTGMLRGGGIDPETGERGPSLLDGTTPGVFGVPLLSPAVRVERDETRAKQRMGVKPKAMKKGRSREGKRWAMPGAGSGPKRCPDCGKRFGSAWGLTVHMGRKHKSDNPAAARQAALQDMHKAGEL